MWRRSIDLTIVLCVRADPSTRSTVKCFGGERTLVHAWYHDCYCVPNILKRKYDGTIANPATREFFRPVVRRPLGGPERGDSMASTRAGRWNNDARVQLLERPPHCKRSIRPSGEWIASLRRLGRVRSTQIVPAVKRIPESERFACTVHGRWHCGP